MANIKSAIKRARTNELARERNRAQRSEMRTAVKKYLIAVDNEDQTTTELLRKASRALDKAASKGIIHKNQAARKKSRLASKINTSK